VCADDIRAPGTDTKEQEYESGNDDTSDEEFAPPSDDSDSPPDDEEKDDGVDDDEMIEITEERCTPAGPWEPSLAAKDGTQWSKFPVQNVKTKTSRKNVFRPPPTQIPSTAHATQPYLAYTLFINDKVMNDIVHYTNLNGYKSQKDWVPCDVVEVEAVIGILLHLGISKQNTLSTVEVWDSVNGIPLVRGTMSRDRFKAILTTMRFDDKESRSARRARDPFAPFRQFWDEFSTFFREVLHAWTVPDCR
jgi:hypothetical protein